MQSYDLSTLRTVFLVGERMDIATSRWFSAKLEEVCQAANRSTAPLVVDHWWQSETGWPMTCIMTGEPLKPEDYAPCRYSLLLRAPVDCPRFLSFRNLLNGRKPARDYTSTTERVLTATLRDAAAGIRPLHCSNSFLLLLQNRQPRLRQHLLRSPLG